jgi:hypothetical protein
MAQRSVGGTIPVAFIEGSAEAIPVDDEAIDTVVFDLDVAHYSSGECRAQ